MDTKSFEKILEANGLGFAYLQDDLSLVSNNKAFQEFIGQPGSLAGAPLQKLIPETVGLENVLADVARGSQARFSLENVNRDAPGESLQYFDISFYHIDDPACPIFCILKNNSVTARLQQQIHQKDNEIRLLEGALQARDDYVSLSIMGDSAPIRKVRATIEKIAHIPSATILLEGESGTGKSMAARVIHHVSKQADTPFVEINCAAIPEALLESELFGYEKGAFTSAIASKAGLLEEADTGTLFLDEIGEMPLKLQAKLLSFLETRRFRRLGSIREQEVKIRLITATNRNIAEMVAEGKFREDLFYRLNVVKIELPPLRRLENDILVIAKNFISVFNVDFQKDARGFTAKAENKLLNYEWPGNVRELKNAVERAMIFHDGDYVDADDLQLGALLPSDASGTPLDRFRLPREGLAFLDIERKLLQDALNLANGNQSKAAQLLHLTRDAFRYRLEKHQLI